MTVRPGMSPVDLCRAQNTLRQQVRALLTGSRLRIRERAHDLVITNPDNPEKGQICIGYIDGKVTWIRTLREHLGPFDGHGDDGDTEVSATKIVEILTSPVIPGSDRLALAARSAILSVGPDRDEG